jgi:hypothetical protein
MLVRFELKAGESVTFTRGSAPMASSKLTVVISDVNRSQGHTLLAARSSEVYSNEEPGEVMQTLYEKARRDQG